jgi:hypothetical protein
MMKTYPTIDAQIVREPIYAFDKLDGSNVRAEWSRKRGFYKFGTRKRLLSEGERFFGKVPGLVQEDFSDELEKIFRKKRWDRAVCFFEFYGPNSFAGWHDEKDEHTLSLFDVVPDKKGILEPREFVKTFGHLNIAELLYRGNPNSEFIDSVRNRTLPGMTFEGVVCKGKYISPGRPLMFKIKSHDWYKVLRDKCNGDKKLYEELA